MSEHFTKNYRCTCGCNVFTKDEEGVRAYYAGENPPVEWYVCNACGVTVETERPNAAGVRHRD